MSRALTREESKRITRRRLLDAAAKLLGNEGYGGLSASAVAREAGVAQPTFYVHFADKKDLVRTLARDKTDATRRALREARQRLATTGGLDALQDTFRIPISGLLEEPGLFRLFVQEAHQPGSPFGAEARALLRDIENDLVEDLIASGAPATTSAERARLQMVAEGLVALTLTFALAHAEERYADLEVIIDVLTQFALGAFGALAKR